MLLLRMLYHGSKQSNLLQSLCEYGFIYHEILNDRKFLSQGSRVWFDKNQSNNGHWGVMAAMMFSVFILYISVR
jgi:hypothetical protein